MAGSKSTDGRTSRRAASKSAERMSGFDFAAWRSASDDPVMRSTIIGLLITETAPNWDQLLDRFDRASRVNTVLRQRVIDQGGLTTPRLIFDSNFDLNFHMRRFKMPAGSTWHDVLEDARRQSMTDFDRDRPLWRVTVLEGLPGGKAAIILKLHHAIADGQGAVLLGASLFDFTPTGEDLGPMKPAPKAEDLDRAGFAQAIVRDKFGWIARTTNDFVQGIGPMSLVALRHPTDTANRIARTVGSLARFTRIPVGPLSPIMTERSINYHFGTFDVPFAKMRAVGKESEHTVNDVFLAAVSDGLGVYHKRLGRPVTRLRINMPVSTRTEGSGSGNAVNIARFEIPISIRETRNLMDQISETVANIRKEPALAFANELGEISRFIPTDILSAAAQASDVTASNVPGIPVPVWIAGARIERMYPLVATIGAAVNITMLTYNGTASVGVSSDDAAVADPDVLLEALRQGFSDAIGEHVPATTPISGEYRETGSKIVQTASSTAKPKSATAKKPSTRKKAPVATAAAKKAPAKKAPAKKTVAKKAPAKKTVAKKAPAKKTVAKKAPAKKTVAKKVAAQRAAADKAVKRVAKQVAVDEVAVKKAVKRVAKKVATQEAAVKKAVAKKAPAKKAPAKKAPAKKTVAKKTVAKKAPAKKTVAKKAPAKKAPAKKTVAKKAPAKKTTARRSR